MNFAAILRGIAHATLTAARVALPLVPVLTNAMIEAQELRNASGAQKKAHVLNIVKDTVDAVNAAKGKTVIDKDSAIETASAGIDTTISVVKLIEASHPVAGV